MVFQGFSRGFQGLLMVFDFGRCAPKIVTQMPYKFDEEQSMSDQKQSNQSAEHDFNFRIYRTVQYTKKTADYVQYNKPQNCNPNAI